MKTVRLIAMLGIAPLAAGTIGVPAVAQSNRVPAAANMAAGDVKAGVEAWTNGDYVTAVKAWRQPALDGDADAQFNMGQAYKLGRGVAMSLGTALEWFGKASRQGHIKASDNYGLVLFQMGRREEAMPHVKTSAERGEPRAQYILGTALFNGQMVEKDWVRAYALMSRSAAAGIPAAARSLSQMEQYIPLDQRQQGTALAARLEKQESANRDRQLAGFVVPGGVPVTAAKPVAVPPSRAPAAASAPAMTPDDLPGYQPSVGAPGTSYSAPGEQVPAVAAVRAPVPQPAPASTASGDWRIQLIAAGNQDEAEAYADMAERKLPELGSLQYYLDFSAKPYVRLQAGPFASKAAADAMCGKTTTVGLACFSRKK